jgi:hypothetical protein
MDIITPDDRRRAIRSTSLFQDAEKVILPRLLKKVQIQGGVTHPEGWVPGVL